MAPESAVATRIRVALAAELKRDVSKIRLEDGLRNDLGLDSLAMIELLFKIEETFDLEIPNEDLSQITTVGDVVAYVERRLGMAAAAPAPALADTATRPAPTVAVAAERPAPVKVATAAKRPPPKVAAAKRPAPVKVAAKRAGTKKKGARRA